MANSFYTLFHSNRTVNQQVIIVRLAPIQTGNAVIIRSSCFIGTADMFLCFFQGIPVYFPNTLYLVFFRRINEDTDNIRILTQNATSLPICLPEEPCSRAMVMMAPGLEGCITCSPASASGCISGSFSDFHTLNIIHTVGMNANTSAIGAAQKMPVTPNFKVWLRQYR